MTLLCFLEWETEIVLMNREKLGGTRSQQTALGFLFKYLERGHMGCEHSVGSPGLRTP